MIFSKYENSRQPLARRSKFIERLLGNLCIVIVLISISLFVGMSGYHFYEQMSWLDAFLNASMILGGMGPVTELHSSGGKFFAGCYALYSGLVLIAATGLLLAPPLHRIMHRLHAEDDGSNSEKRKR
jgi:hypothetical protein